VLSSTSSSNERLPRGEWVRVLLGALLICAVFAGVLELRLAARGYRPAVADSEELWAHERQRAADLGDKALILVGASRIQLDTDLDTLRAATGLEPVQLALDGSSFVPVLRGLADDPRVTGTVIVDFMPRAVSEWDKEDAAIHYEADYERQRNRSSINAQASENVLTRLRARVLRSYADGATPLNSLLKRVLSQDPVEQYLLMKPDRSRLADYARVTMPDFYYGRVMLALGREPVLEAGTPISKVESDLRREIAAIEPADPERFRARLPDLNALVEKIEARGGRVVLVTFPTSGLVHDIDERHYPRERFWDAFTSGSTGRTLHVDDDARLRGFTCPDGSHLDYRSRPAFTRALADALGLSRDGAGTQATAPNR